MTEPLSGPSLVPGDGSVLPGGVFVGRGEGAQWPHWVRRRRRRGAARRRVRTAFVFAGGGARGAAQVGMLQALTAHGIAPDAIYGASVGAINAAGFAGDPTIARVEFMAEQWRLIQREDVFPQGRFPTPWRFFQTREAVFPSDGVRRIIQTGLNFDRIEQSAVHLEVVATSLTDGRPRWFASGPAEPAILASAALPALLPPVVIDGESFIDGGVVDNVPIRRAIEQGAQRIFVLLCGPLHYTPQKYRRPVEAVLTAFFIAVNATFAEQLEVLPPGIEVVVFTVDTTALSGYDDFSGTDALLATGRANAEAVLDFWRNGGVGESITGPPRQASPPPLPLSEEDSFERSVL